MTLTVVNSINVAALQYSLHVTTNSAHSSSDIEDAFDDELPNNRIIGTGNRVVASSFLVGK